jgi:hypothetical protein
MYGASQSVKRLATFWMFVGLTPDTGKEILSYLKTFVAALGPTLWGGGVSLGANALEMDATAARCRVIFQYAAWKFL